MGDFLAPLLRGLMLAFQSGMVGGAAFAVLVAPLGGKLAKADTLKWAGLAALGTAAMALASLWALIANLMSNLDLSFGEAIGADFVRHLGLVAAAALVTAFFCLPCAARRMPWLAAMAAMAAVAFSVAGGHGASRVEGRLPLMAADFVHQMAAGLWLGGIPFLLAALARAPGGRGRIALCRRFSAMAMVAVAVLALSAVALAIVHVGSWQAMIGTDFGAMALVKMALLGILLLLGLGNFRAGPCLDQPAPLRRLRAFAVAELGIGLAVLMIAASLSAQPPPAATPEQVAAPADMLSRLLPERWPRFTAPMPTQPGSPEDRAWAEMTHHWAGLVVLAMGILALLRPLPGFRWARHWPLLFLAIALGIPLLSDPDSWPLGPYGFWGKPGDVEVPQHRLAALLVAAFALIEWAVQTGKLRRLGPALVFPASCGLGGLLLLTHGHPNSQGVDALLIHLSHMTIAILGLIAGAGRWIELAADEAARPLAARLWPTAFALVGVVLLVYREG
ncbi:MAG: CopD family protein [Magnetospirillum sp.]|nr:CopD family protein [Magnetospirillum sp.]